MFGHDDKQKDEEHMTGGNGAVVQPISTTPPDENLVGVTPDPAPTTAPVASDDDDDDIDKIVDDINSDDNAVDEQADTEPAAAPAVEPEPETEPQPETSQPEVEQPPVHEPSDEPTLNETPAELLEVKKSALQELSPLLDELDQPADEKLNILMMTIQATDDQALLPQAFETAKKIEDKKARAEAMLDIIQEINYFTKKQ